nr:N2,N2-dimethylguanosine tRNA methyltransferase [Cyanobium sp. Morenito 9A2]
MRVRTGDGFFRPQSRPSRDLGVLLARWLRAEHGRLRVLDLMAGCGIRALRYGLEAGAEAIWANDADPERLPLLETNLAPLAGPDGAGKADPERVRCTARTAQQLLAGCLLERRRFELVDLDGFGCPTALLPLALEAVAFDGVLYLASTDGRSPTGHDRPAAIRSLGAAARAHPASWELALRLQLGVIARSAWAMGRGMRPLFSFSEGRTFRTAVQLRRRPEPGEETNLGLLAHCHGCGDQQAQSLLRLRGWAPCGCGASATGAAPSSISGPLWIGPLQECSALGAMAIDGGRSGAEGASASLGREGARLLAALSTDPGLPPRCWPLAEIARRLGRGPPRLAALLAALRADGWQACSSAVMAAQVRTDAPWPRLLELAQVVGPGQTSPAAGVADDKAPGA